MSAHVGILLRLYDLRQCLYTHINNIIKGLGLHKYFMLTDNIFNFNFSSVRRSPTMRPQQDFSRSFCSCCCPPHLSCSFLVPLGLLSHYLSTSLVVFLCYLFRPLVRIALLPVVCFPPSLLRIRTTSAFFF